ncbi:MAG: nitrogen fixation protein FixH [Gammaproteobacteria bacterium]|nr:nitrogen fixation protein FixH [Gammaproteobacteria bacterium]
MTASRAQTRPIPAWKSPWVIGWVTLVLVVLIVNLTLVVLGISTNPGLVIENFYDRGQNYEKNWASKQAHDPGWVMQADVPRDLVVGEPKAIRFFLVDKAGRPAAVEEAHFYAYRPSDSQQDFDLPMIEEGPGHYRVDVSFPLVGAWDTLVAVRYGGEEFTHGRRVQVPAVATRLAVPAVNGEFSPARQ